jgi:outer membrane protein OmpA-like peptidoglycan-associated protein
VKVDFKTEKIEIGKSFTMNDVFFATASYELNAIAQRVLLAVVDFLKENPAVKLGVYGHTDNVNDSESNQVLSENRARVVFEYIVSNGIAENRLTYKGFGETKPVAGNDTPEGRAKNRRTEFVITAK